MATFMILNDARSHVQMRGPQGQNDGMWHVIVRSQESITIYRTSVQMHYKILHSYTFSGRLFLDVELESWQVLGDPMEGE